MVDNSHAGNQPVASTDSEMAALGCSVRLMLQFAAIATCSPHVLAFRLVASIHSFTFSSVEINALFPYEDGIV